METVEPVLKKMYQKNTYRKDLSEPHFSNEPWVNEKHHVKGQQSCIFVFVTCLERFQVATTGTSPDMTTIFHTWAYDRLIEIQNNLRKKSLHRTN